jgi:predicted metal-dependent HD superfamily phosphohydrolase
MAASDGQIDDTARQRIFDLIMATDHSHAPTEHDQRFIVEVDLSGFGLPWDRFQSDGRNVRGEMTHLTDDEFYPAQMRFMQSLADRKPLYTYPWFFERYESAARSNIARYTSELQQRGYQMKAAV